MTLAGTAPAPQRPVEQLSPRDAPPPPLALYVHFPWCVRKCPYCDFNSHRSPETLPENDYIAALLADLDAAAAALIHRPLVSIFMGGGTPSLISAAGIGRLLEGVARRLAMPNDIEITLEANPGTVEAERFAAYRAAGVNRLSLGVQSFDDEKLAALGRIHGSREAMGAARAALKIFERVNLDLMTGLPRQSLAESAADLQAAIALGPSHLSAYALTLEPNTPFHHTPPPLPDDDLAADMQDQARQMLAAAGYRHYETSAYAQPGQECRHNLNYWTFGDYLGIGAGAHGKLTTAGGVMREHRHRHPKDYLAAAETGGSAFLAGRQAIAREDLPGEFMMNALRLNDGFSPALFGARTGLPLAEIAAPLQRASARGLLAVSDDRIAPTVLGQRFLNTLVGEFLAGGEGAS